MTLLDDAWVCMTCLTLEVKRHRAARNHLRDRIALRVLTSTLMDRALDNRSNQAMEPVDLVARASYQIADAMLAAREQP